MKQQRKLKRTLAGFAEIDITPPIGTQKIGWLKKIFSERIIDPLFARVAVFKAGSNAIAVIQLDTLSIGRTQVQDIRRRIQRAYGIPGAHVMVAATHNHAGPALLSLGDTLKDDRCVEMVTARCVSAVGTAIKCLAPAVIGFAHTFEWRVAHNRRIIMRDGTTRTHGRFTDPNALCFEGPIDPEVAVVAARRPNGKPIGCIVSFACHPTHFGDGPCISAGYPGQLAAQMKKKGWPVTLFLNGACGNVHTSDPVHGGADKSMYEVAAILSKDAIHCLESMKYRSDITLSASSRMIRLPFRKLTRAEITGAAHGTQRFVDGNIYKKNMPALIAKIRKEKFQTAEVQILSIGNHIIAGIPAEYFVEHGLRIKQEAFPVHALIAAHANGMVGYVPTQDAFRRGGYETTFGEGSCLAPCAGDMLADTAIKLIKNLKTGNQLLSGKDKEL